MVSTLGSMTKPTSDPDGSPEEALDTITVLPHPPPEGSSIPQNKQKGRYTLAERKAPLVRLPEKADPQANHSPATSPPYMSLGAYVPPAILPSLFL